MTKLTPQAVFGLTQSSRGAAVLGLGLCLALAPARSSAERWSASASVDGRLTATDNANFDAHSEKQGDVIVELAPRVSIQGEGARLRLSGSAGFSAFTYTKGTQDSQVVPSAAASLWLEAIERTFFIESNVNVARVVDNPFGPQAPTASNINTQDTYQARVSPYFTGILASRFRYLLRHDSAWTRSSGGTTSIGNQYASHEAAELAMLPRPFGASLRYDRDETNRIEGSEGRSRSEIARATLSLSPDPQFTIGVRGGHERNNFPGFNTNRNFFGAELTWRPTERTNLALAGENRFFGKGWTATFDHRMPRLAWSLRSSRDVSTSAQRFLGLPVTLDVAALIDASLTTRIPDPIERARAVEDLIVSRGLPRSLIAPIDIFDERIEIQKVNTATVSLLGARNTIALTLFSTSTEGLESQTGGIPPATALLDNRQRGIGLSLSHQLSPLTTVNAESSWRQTRGLGSSSDEQSRQQTYQLRFTRLLSPKTSTTAGARYQVFDSTLQQDTTEKAVFLGIAHRF